MATHGNYIQLQNQTSALNSIKAQMTTLNGHNDQVETKLDTVSTKLSGGLPSALTGSGHLSVSIDEIGAHGSERLNVDVGSTVLQLPTALTGEGNLKVSIQEDHTHDLATAANQVSTNTKLDTLETSLTSIEGKMDVDNAVYDNQLTKLTSIEGKVVLPAALTGSGNLKVCIQELGNEGSERLNVDVGDDITQLPTALTGSGNLKVSIEEGAISGFATAGNQSTIIGHVDGLEAKLDTLETSLTSIEGKMDVDNVVYDNQLTKQGEIETSLNSLISANHTDLVALESSLTSIEGKIDTLDSVLDNVLTKQSDGLQQVKIKGVFNSSLPTVSDGNFEFLQCDTNGRIEVRTHSDDTGVATTINTPDSAAIPITGVLVHDDDNNAVRSLKCDSSGRLRTVQEGALPAGTNAIGKLSANSGVDIGDVDVTSIAAGTNRIGMVALKANENVAGSGTERHLLCDSAGHLQVDVVSAPSTAVTGTVTANLSATDNAVLDDIAQKAGDIETSVQLIDDVVKAEDAAHSSGDKGIMALAVRQSTQADFGADGDYVPLSINDDGQLRVTTANGSGMTLTTVDSSLAIGNGATDTSAAVEIKSSGNINILVQSGVLGSSFVLALEASMDGSTFHAFNSSYLTQNNSGNSIQAFIDPSAFRPKFIKLKITNNDVGSQNFDSFVFQ